MGVRLYVPSRPRKDDVRRFDILRTTLRADGVGGRGWTSWLLMSHAAIVASVLGSLDASSKVDRLVDDALMVIGVLTSLWFWRNWLRVWRRMARERDERVAAL
jgi:hypothetical protein